jgi:sensor histidine kinase YesM
MWRAWQIPKTKLTFKILFNLILWGLWIGLPLLSPVHQSHENDHPHGHVNPEFSEHIWLELLTVVPLFYIITLFLVPRVFKRFGVFWFFASLFGMIVLFFGIQSLYHIYFLPFDKHEGFFDMKGIFPLVMISGIGSTYGLLLEFINIESEKEERSNEQLKSELAFLRSQISPHFIFNILNSIVYLIRTKADKQAEDVTIRLSSLMRYMLYDSDQSMVALDRELEYLRNYIDLQRMRFEGDVKIDFQVEGTVRGCRIEPMLLIPFVENAVKHGVSFVHDPFIHIYFSINHGHMKFEVKNKKGQLQDDVKDESSGIGLKNVLRRLDLLYPNQHRLDIRDTSDVFEVNLEMTLQQF